MSDAALDIGGGLLSLGTSARLAKAGAAVSPGVGTLIGLGVGLFYDLFLSQWIADAI